MTEILTESFCERCGTRYTFESSAPRTSRIGRAKMFTKGVRNFVLTDESSFAEAMADARSEVELSATAHQLDAFHKTFNFCLNCRQYTCGSCWNTGEGRCLTCSPDAEEVSGAERVAPVAVAESPVEPTTRSDEAWPQADVPTDRQAALPGGAGPSNGHASPDRGQPWRPDETQADLEAEAAAMVDAQLEAEAIETADAEIRSQIAAVARSEAEAARVAAARVAAARVEAEAAELMRVEAVRVEVEAAEAEAEAARVEAEAAELMRVEAVRVEAEAAETEAEAARVEAEAARLKAEVTELGRVEVERLEAEATEASAAKATAAPTVRGLAPGQSLEDAIAAWEAQQLAQPDPESEPEPVAAAEPEPEPVAAAQPDPEPEPVAAAQPDPEPEPVAAAQPDPEPEPVAAAQPDPEPVAAAEPTRPQGDLVSQPTWPIPTPQIDPQTPAPAAPSPAAPAPWLTVAPDDGTPEPQWPAAPVWPSPDTRGDAPATLAGRMLLPQQGNAAALWAASAREVLAGAPSALPATAATPTPQPCIGCGLSLSANARFCRRCGTRQP
jgi:hypothetical protein